MGRSRRLTDRAAQVGAFRAMDVLLRPPGRVLDVRGFTAYLDGVKIRWPALDELRRPDEATLLGELGRALARGAFAEWVASVSPRLPSSGPTGAP